MKLLSERLHWAMREKEKRDGITISPADVARSAKVTDAGASHWFSDTNGIGASKARLIADYLAIDPIWLETGEGSATGSMHKKAAANIIRDAVTPQEISELILFYGRSDIEGRQLVMATAKSAAGVTQVSRGRKSRNNS